MVFNADDDVTGADAGFGGGRIGDDAADLSRLVHINGLGKLHAEQDGHQDQGEEDVHQGPGDGDDHALVARFVHEAARILAVFAVLSTGHFDVAAKGDRANLPIGFSAANAEQPRTEADGKGVDFDVEITGGPIMAQLMDDDHDAD